MKKIQRTVATIKLMYLTLSLEFGMYVKMNIYTKLVV